MNLNRDKIIEIGLVSEIKIREDVKTKLIEIFNYYKENYHLDTTFEYCDYHRHGSHYSSFDIINISEKTTYDLLKTPTVLKICKNIDDFLNMAIWSLLHEIKHTIQFYYDKEKWKNGKILHVDLVCENINFQLKLKKYRQLPLEKEADEFARQEIDKWR